MRNICSLAVCADLYAFNYHRQYSQLNRFWHWLVLSPVVKVCRDLMSESSEMLQPVYGWLGEAFANTKTTGAMLYLLDRA